MLKISITGGIGSGKSTVAKIVECLGFPVYYADERGRYISENDPLVLQGIKDRFGPTIFSHGKLLRQELAAIVFSDPEKLRQLNAIVHPAVRQDYEMWLSEQKSTLVFSEIAILFESGRNTDFDKTVLITAPEELKLSRVVKRSGLTPEEVKRRMSNQWTDVEKSKLADFVVNNDGESGLIRQVVELVKGLSGLGQDHSIHL